MVLIKTGIAQESQPLIFRSCSKLHLKLNSTIFLTVAHLNMLFGQIFIFFFYWTHFENPGHVIALCSEANSHRNLTLHISYPQCNYQTKKYTWEQWSLTTQTLHFQCTVLFLTEPKRERKFRDCWAEFQEQIHINAGWWLVKIELQPLLGCYRAKARGTPTGLPGIFCC